MWLFTQYGFFSVVSAREGRGEAGMPVDPGRVQVRARRREHVTALVDRFQRELGGLEIMETPSADYRFRLIVPKEPWVRVVVALAEELDYDNFKGRCGSRRPALGPGYINALHEVWETMYELQ